MGKSARIGLVAAFWLTFVSHLKGDDQAKAKAVVDKAVRAVGGEDQLNKFKGAAWKGKGKFYGLGSGIDFTGEWVVQPPEQARIITRAEFNGQTFKKLLIINGDKGWIQLNGQTEGLDAETLTEEKERLHANWAATLLPLLHQDFQLSTLEEASVAGRLVVGVKAVRGGHRNVELYFDKEKGLLLKYLNRIKDLHKDVEVTQAVFLSDYKEIQGVLRPLKVKTTWDDKVIAEAEFSEFKALEKMEEKVFAKP